jgi:hypothetical protein
MLDAEARREGPDPRGQEAIRLMMRFAERTGLTSDRPQQRYLWTDAFAVCNFLGFARATGDARYRDLGLRLVDRVHQTLGRHRLDDARSGWISGLSERAGVVHPTRGGLRIGKRLPERPPGEPSDEQLEWERDGQYFHYLTKWMHALDQVSRSTRQPRFNLLARELAETAFRAFSYRPPGGARLRMVWKLSIDLSRPLVSSMGQHDALDGLVTCAQLQATATRLGGSSEGPSLQEAAAGFASMAEAGSWATNDPLGIGGLLMEACRVQQLVGEGVILSSGLVGALLGAALEGLANFVEQDELRQLASARLAFRELGLSIGLKAVALMHQQVQSEPRRYLAAGDVRAQLADLGHFASLSSEIESFWLVAEHRGMKTWEAHRDINEVMLATSLMPAGCLALVET